MTQRKTYLGPLTDSRRWDHVALRGDDVIVVTPPKSGTTWMQTLVALLLSGDPDVETDLSVKMPWVDIRFREIAEVAGRLEAMTARRCLKSHTPLDGLPVQDMAQVICVFRHPLDAHFSYRKHLANMPITFFDHWYRAEDPDGITFRRFLDGGAEGFDGDAMPLAHILRHYQAARAAAAAGSNVALFHYADMSRDLPGTLTRLATLLGTPHDQTLMERFAEVASFAHMRANAARYAPSGGTGFMRSDTDFFDSGGHGKWHGHLSEDELSAYSRAMDAALSPNARAWLEYGDTGAP
ncbi:sulfotransferase domain-containing protein [Pseudaestuariivita sp.]|uniref:sulfotransferase domain-containing protein n=1 Tax=Pseudaestuariivita sp. TaxID=2211669 RepID=UPI004058B377